MLVTGIRLLPLALDQQDSRCDMHGSVVAKSDSSNGLFLLRLENWNFGRYMSLSTWTAKPPYRLVDLTERQECILLHSAARVEECRRLPFSVAQFRGANLANAFVCHML
jgi:hypothetical protein